MKIVILVSMFPPSHIGGAEIAAQNEARFLSKRGHDVFVVTSSARGIKSHYKEDGFSANRIYYPKVKFFGVIIFWLRCFFTIRKINPDIVYVEIIQMGIPCFLAKKIFNIPYVVQCQGSDVYLPWRLKKVTTKIVFNNAAAVIALTENMKAEIKKNYKNNLFIIPNGINLEEFKVFPRQLARKELGIKEEENVVIFIGSLKAVKGVKYLIEAVSIAREKGVWLKLLLVGGGEEKEELRNLSEKFAVKDCVSFIGSVQNKEVSKYMGASDIFVLPSLSEGFGIVNLEAMACGLPVIATNVGGIPDIIKDGENGFLVDPKDSAQIAEKILLLFENAKLRAKMSANNKEEVKKYSLDIVTDKLIDVYSSCLKK